MFCHDGAASYFGMMVQQVLTQLFQKRPIDSFESTGPGGSVLIGEKTTAFSLYRTGSQIKVVVHRTLPSLILPLLKEKDRKMDLFRGS